MRVLIDKAQLLAQPIDHYNEKSQWAPSVSFRDQRIKCRLKQLGNAFGLAPVQAIDQRFLKEDRELYSRVPQGDAGDGREDHQCTTRHGLDCRIGRCKGVETDRKRSVQLQNFKLRQE